MVMGEGGRLEHGGVLDSGHMVRRWNRGHKHGRDHTVAMELQLQLRPYQGQEYSHNHSHCSWARAGSATTACSVLLARGRGKTRATGKGKQLGRWGGVGRQEPVGASGRGSISGEDRHWGGSEWGNRR